MGMPVSALAQDVQDMQDMQDMPEMPAVDDALLLPPVLEGLADNMAETPPAPPDMDADMDADTLSSATKRSLSHSRVATIHILKELSRRADMGDATCQFQLGYLYAHGQGVRQDDREAIRWYRKAASNGHPDALVAMAEAFDLGRGVLKNPVAAYVLAKAAVAIKPEAAVIANSLKAKLSAKELAIADTTSVSAALKLK